MNCAALLLHPGIRIRRALFLGSLGVAAAWLGIIERISDGLSSFAKLGSGFYTDGLPRRKPIALAGYIITAFATASIV
jgi:hypothetical protein